MDTIKCEILNQSFVRITYILNAGSGAFNLRPALWWLSVKCALCSAGIDLPKILKTFILTYCHHCVIV